jgi:Malectin domain
VNKQSDGLNKNITNYCHAIVDPSILLWQAGGREIQHHQSNNNMKWLFGGIATVLLRVARLGHTNTQTGRVIGLRLIQGGTATIEANLFNGTIVRVAASGSTPPSFSVEAITTGSPISNVQFAWNGNATMARNENVAPYALCGDNGTALTPCPSLTFGTHTISARVNNNVATAYQVTFQIATASAPIAPPPKAAAPVSAPLLPLSPKAPPPPISAPVSPPAVAAPVKVPVLVPAVAPVQAPAVAPALTPATAPVKAPTPLAPVTATVVAPAVAPVQAPALAPIILAPITALVLTPPALTPKAPILPPASAPAKAPTKAPLAMIPTKAPIAPPVQAPTKAPVVVTAPASSPKAAPVAVPPPPLSNSSSSSSSSFVPIRINCGSTVPYTDSLGRAWSVDAFFAGGSAFASGIGQIANTTDDVIYRSERFGEATYNIPVPPGTYDVVLHFAEI